MTSIFERMFQNIFDREITEYKSINIEYQNGTIIMINIVKNNEGGEEAEKDE